MASISFGFSLDFRMPMQIYADGFQDPQKAGGLFCIYTRGQENYASYRLGPQYMQRH